MAQNFQNTQSVDTSTFPKGMNRDSDPRFLQQGQYIFALNAALNSHEGDLYKIGNEPATLPCAPIPYTLIGTIRLKDDRYAVFSTNNVDSEIGLFDERSCSYQKVASAPCLSFRTTHLIQGVAKENSDCSESLYWNDGLNPARHLNLQAVPWVQRYRRDPEGGCDLPQNTDQLDCEALRLTPLLTVPNPTLSLAAGGALPNGAYRVAVAYSHKGIRITDYLNVSDIQYVYQHAGNGGALDVVCSNLDRRFDEYTAVLIATVNQQTTARVLGFYPVEQVRLHIDTLKADDERVDLADIALQSPYYEGGEGMFKAGAHLIQTAVRSRPGFNYQPQASKIRAKWVAYAVPEDYYKKGGKHIGYTKGENLALAIRFVYNTGHRSEAFPLIGPEAASVYKERVTGADALSYGQGEVVERWELEETATLIRTHPVLPGAHIAYEGEFGYHESTEIYPDNREVYGSLSCKPVRLFRFPGNELIPNWDERRQGMLILGFRLENITYPLDAKGKPIPGIQGYEVLRADKEGSKEIVAKGMIYNTQVYDLIGGGQGLLPNYPGNDLRQDPYLSSRPVKGGCEGKDYRAMGTFKRDVFTFHSPETHFANPALGSVLRVEAEYAGTMRGRFEPVYRHPKAKLVRDFAFFVSALVGIGEGILAISGKTTYYNYPTYLKAGVSFPVSGEAYTPLPMASNFFSGTAIGDLLSSVAKGKGAHGRTRESTSVDGIPLPLRILNSAALATYYFGMGTEQALNIIQRLVPFQQHGYQYVGEALYRQSLSPRQGQRVRRIKDYSYLYPALQEFAGHRVNNRFRESSVIVQLDRDLSDPRTVDTSRQTIGTMRLWEDPQKPFEQPTSAYYVSIRRRVKSQYGAPHQWRLVPTGSGVLPLSVEGRTASPDIFGGDTIIEELTLKRKQSFFTQTASGMPDGFEFDYRLYPNVPYPRYWMDSHKYDISQFFRITDIQLPNDLHHLDRDRADCRSKASFVVKNGYFYLHSSAVVRFYVESSYHLTYRQNSTTKDEEKHFDKSFFTDLSVLFRSDLIHRDNHFEIDRTFSPIKTLNLTYGQLQARDFSLKNQKCYSYEPNKLIYSLPAHLEQRGDNWRHFLANDYWVFNKADGKVSTIKELENNAVLYLFHSAPAKLHTGAVELQTDAGIKVQVGDGSLFAREPQTVGTSEFDYGECQSARSVVSTPYGVYFVSQAQGKIFQFTGQLQDISIGLKWWLARYLPSRLLAHFPEAQDLGDNPVSGVGVHAVYDPTNETVYFAKKDYEVKPEYTKSLTYLGEGVFEIDGRRRAFLGDPRYFVDASWTLSYDPKLKAWVSFHSWVPDWLLQGKTHFLSFKDGRTHLHNVRTDLFAHYYGIQAPWEVRFPALNTQEVTTLESVEYQLEAYKYSGRDRYHVYDVNFDEAEVFNSEQHSGLLKLHQREDNRPLVILQYPRVNGDSVDIEYTKQEQVYRFNQFCDLTANRGIFSLQQEVMFLTAPNGYQEVLNPQYINYNKPAPERKPMRHHSSIVSLRKRESGEYKMLLMLVHQKQVKSFR